MYQAASNTGGTEKISNFECHFCAQVFNSDMEMKTHMLSHIKEEPLQGIDEPAEVSPEEIQPSGTNILPSDGIKQEPIDGNSEGDYYNTNVVNFKCSICGTEFRHKGHYARHLLRHGIESDNIPSLQKRTHVTSSQLKTSVVRKKRYKCLRCGLEYRYQGHYFRHMMKHETKMKRKGTDVVVSEKMPSGPVPSESETKTRTSESEPVPLSSTPEKKPSITVNSPNKRYECLQCNKTFRLKSILRRHSLIHSGIKPFKCNMCGMACARKDNLNLHMAICVQRKRPYRCKVCHEDCKSSGMLKQHMFIHIGEEDVNPEYLLCSRKSLPGRKVDLLERKFGDTLNSPTNSISIKSEEDELDDTSNSPTNSQSVKPRKVVLDDTSNSPSDSSKKVKLSKNIKCEETKVLASDESPSFGEHPYKDSVVIWEDATRISVSVKHLVANMRKQFVKCTVCGHQFSHLGHLKLHMKQHDRLSADECDSPTNKESVNRHDETNKSEGASSLQEDVRCYDNEDSSENILPAPQENESSRKHSSSDAGDSPIKQVTSSPRDTASIKNASTGSEENVRLHDKEDCGDLKKMATEGSVKHQGNADCSKDISSNIPGAKIFRRKFRCSICSQTFKHEGFYRRHLRWHASKTSGQNVSENERKIQNDCHTIEATCQKQNPHNDVNASDRTAEPVASSSLQEPQNELHDAIVLNAADIKKEKLDISCPDEDSHRKPPLPSTKCSECDRRFKRANHLVLHKLRAHGKKFTGKRARKRNFPFECCECGRGFKHRAHLVLHLKQHPQSLNNTNVLDTKKEETLASCLEEAQTKLPELVVPQAKLAETVVKCAKCDQQFQDREQLHLHMQKNHEAQSDGLVTFNMKKEVNTANFVVEKTQTELLVKTTNKCSECDREFKHEYHLALHMMRSHKLNYGGKKTYKVNSRMTHKCLECNREFKQGKYLTLHMRKHVQKVDAVKAPSCKEEVEVSHSMKGKNMKISEVDSSVDISNEVPELKANCSECGLAFKHRGYLLLHMRRHRNRRVLYKTSRRKNRDSMAISSLRKTLTGFSETVQEKDAAVTSLQDKSREGFQKYNPVENTMTSNTVKRAVTGIHENYPEKDVSVSSITQVKGEETTHEIIPEKDVPKTRRTLKRASRDTNKIMHAQNGKYRCPICLKVFRFPGGIVRHLVVHSNEKPFTCMECGKGCNREDNLRLHMKKCFLSRGKKFEYHKRKIESADGKKFLPVKPVRALMCRVCGKSFSRKNMFMKHIIQHKKQDFLRVGYFQAIKPADFNQNVRYSPIIAKRHPITGFYMKSELRVALKKLELGRGKTFQVSKLEREHTVHPEHNVEHKRKEGGACVTCGGTVEQNHMLKGKQRNTECKMCEKNHLRTRGGTNCEPERNTSETVEVEELQSKDYMPEKIISSEDVVQEAKAPLVKIQELKSFRNPGLNLYDFSSRMHVCLFCSKRFKTKHSLTRHIYQHLTGKSSDCKDWEGHPKNYLTEYLDNVSTKCSICGKVFDNCEYLEDNLAQHMKNHLVVCSAVPLCAKFEGSDKELKDCDTVDTEVQHVQSSGQNKALQRQVNRMDMIPLLGKHKLNYSCHECGKVFLRKFGIKEHMMEHYEETTYRGKDFKSSQKMDQHLRSYAQHSTQDACVKCGNMFVKIIRPGRISERHVCMKCKERSVKSHLTRNERVLHKCKVCQRKCSGLRGLRIHMAVHLKKKQRGLKKCHEKVNSKPCGTNNFEPYEFVGFERRTVKQETKINNESHKAIVESDSQVKIYSGGASSEVCGKGLHTLPGTVSGISRNGKESDLVAVNRFELRECQNKAVGVHIEKTQQVLPKIQCKSDLHKQADATVSTNYTGVFNKGVLNSPTIDSDNLGKSKISQRTHAPAIMVGRMNGVHTINLLAVNNNKREYGGMSALGKTALHTTSTSNDQKSQLQLGATTTNVSNLHSKEIKGIYLTKGAQHMNVRVQLKSSSDNRNIQNSSNTLPNITNPTFARHNFVQLCPVPGQGLRISQTLNGLLTRINPSPAVLNVNNPRLPCGTARSEVRPQSLSTMKGVKTGGSDLKDNTNILSPVKLVGLAGNATPGANLLTQSERPVKIMVNMKGLTSSANSTHSSLASTSVQNSKKFESLPTPVKISCSSSLAENTLTANMLSSLKPDNLKINSNPSQTDRMLQQCSKPSIVRYPEGKQFDLVSGAACIKDLPNPVPLPITVKSGQVSGAPVKALMQIDKVLIYPDSVRQSKTTSTVTSTNITSVIGSDHSSVVKSRMSPAHAKFFVVPPVVPPSVLNSFSHNSSAAAPQLTKVAPDCYKDKKEHNCPPSKRKRKNDSLPREKNTAVPAPKKIAGSSRKKKNAGPLPKMMKVGAPQVGKVTFPTTETSSSSVVSPAASPAVKASSLYNNAEEDFDQALLELGRPIRLEDMEIKEEEINLEEISVEDFDFWEGLPVKETVPDEKANVP